MQEYQRDFPPVSAEVYTSAPVTITSETGGNINVKVTNTIESESEYEAKMAEHTAMCQRAEVDAIKQYINSRVICVVSKNDCSDLTKA